MHDILVQICVKGMPNNCVFFVAKEGRNQLGFEWILFEELGIENIYFLSVGYLHNGEEVIGRV